jgi:hypothetical protein
MNSKTGKTGRIAMIIAAVVLAAAVIVATIVLTRPKQAEEPAGMQVPIIDADNIENVLDDLKEKSEKGQFNTWMTVTWSFPDGESPSSDAIVGNSEANNYPFFFDVILDDTNETVYSSSLIPVGSQVKEIKLNRDLPKGAYEATITYHLVDDTNNNEVIETNLSFGITISVSS